MVGSPAVPNEPVVVAAPGGDRRAAGRTLAVGVAVYALSRILVLIGAGLVSVAKEVADLDPDQPALRPLRPTSALSGIVDVLTSWDGNWYMEVVRHGYPRVVPPDVTYFQLEARAAFFPLYPLLTRVADRVLPGGDVAAAIALNVAVGLAAILAVGHLARLVFDDGVARRAMVLVALFPGSFALSFTYSEAVLVALAALCLTSLVQRRWLAAGILAGFATASRPNAVALVVACAVAALLAVHRRREWRALAAPVLAPAGWLSFHAFLAHQTGEWGVWFRIQREAWQEGVSFGATAVSNAAQALAHPLTSPTDTLILATLVAMGGLLWGCWKAGLPAPLWAYSAAVLVLMLIPDTVTARPRFLFTAFPLFIGFAAWWERADARSLRARWERDLWPYLIAVLAAGLTTVTVLYGLYSVAIP
jgi:hypothetical protein